MSFAIKLQRKSALVSAVGIANLVYGGLFLAAGVYVFAAGGEAVSRLLEAGQTAGKLGDASLPPEQAGKVGAALDQGSKGLAGFFAAMAGLVGGCLFVQGLPLLLTGVGVLRRRPWGRVLGILFAVLATLQGLGLLFGAGRTTAGLTAGLLLSAYAILSFVGLLNHRAGREFAGLVDDTPSEQAAPELARNRARLVLALVALMIAVVGGGVVFAVLNPSSKSGPNPAGQPGAAAAIELPNREARVAEFHEAINKGQVSRALELLKLGVHADDPDAHGETALWRTAAAGQARMTVLLLASGAQINDKNAKGRTPLMQAAAAGHEAVVALLLGKGPALEEILAFRRQFLTPRLGDVTGKLPASVPDLKTLKDLPSLPDLAAFKPPPVYIDAQDAEGRTALMLAARGGHLGVVKQLVGGVDPRASNDLTDRDGNTASMLAAAAGHLEVLMASEPGWNQFQGQMLRKNREGKTAYELAAIGGHQEVTAYLWSTMNATLKGLGMQSPLPKEDVVGKAGDSPLFKAVQTGDLEALQALVKQGTAVEGRDEQGRTALMVAAGRGDTQAVLFLTAHVGKAHPEQLDARDREGRTALMHAAAAGHAATVDVLLLAVTVAWDRGKLNWCRHLERTDKSGKTALQLAKSHQAVVDKLESFWKESLDSRRPAEAGMSGRSALEAASEEGDLPTVQALLKRKANPAHNTGIVINSPSALMLAAKNGHILVVRAIVDSFGENRPALADYLKRGSWTAGANTYGADNAAFQARTAGHNEIAALLLREQNLAEAPPGK